MWLFALIGEYNLCKGMDIFWNYTIFCRKKVKKYIFINFVEKVLKKVG